MWEHCIYNESWLKNKTENVWHLIVLPSFYCCCWCFLQVFACCCHVNPNGSSHCYTCYNNRWNSMLIKTFVFEIIFYLWVGEFSVWNLLKSLFKIVPISDAMILMYYLRDFTLQILSCGRQESRKGGSYHGTFLNLT